MPSNPDSAWLGKGTTLVVPSSKENAWRFSAWGSLFQASADETAAARGSTQSSRANRPRPHLCAELRSAWTGQRPVPTRPVLTSSAPGLLLRLSRIALQPFQDFADLRRQRIVGKKLEKSLQFIHSLRVSSPQVEVHQGEMAFPSSGSRSKDRCNSFSACTESPDQGALEKVPKSRGRLLVQSLVDSVTALGRSDA